VDIIACEVMFALVLYSHVLGLNLRGTARGSLRTAVWAGRCGGLPSSWHYPTPQCKRAIA
jgi:hypothetical protein